MFPLFFRQKWLNPILNPLGVQRASHKTKHNIKKTFNKSSKRNLKPIFFFFYNIINQKQILTKFYYHQDYYRYTQSKWPTAPANDCSRIKLHGLVELSNFISLGMDFLDPLDLQITGLLFQTNRSKHLIFKY